MSMLESYIKSIQDEEKEVNCNKLVIEHVNDEFIAKTDLKWISLGAMSEPTDGLMHKQSNYKVINENSVDCNNYLRIMFELDEHDTNLKATIQHIYSNVQNWRDNGEIQKSNTIIRHYCYSNPDFPDNVIWYCSNALKWLNRVLKGYRPNSNFIIYLPPEDKKSIILPKTDLVRVL